MTLEVAVMLTLIVATLVVFFLEIFPIEVTAMGLLGTLFILGFVGPDEVTLGLSNKAVVTIGALLVLSRALMKTGVLEVGAFYLSRQVGQHKWLGIGVFLAVSAFLSGFLNNTAVVAVFIPLALSLCRRFEISPSKVLLPLSYIAIVGGLLTVIGTSTNLLVSSLAERAGEPPIRMFEFTSLAILFVVLTLGYSLLVGRRVLPERVRAESLAGAYNLASYLTEVQVPADSRLVGKSPRESHIRERYQISVISILRGEKQLTQRVPFEPLRAGDVLIVEGDLEDVLRLRNEQKVTLLPEVKFDDQSLSGHGQVIAEAIIPVTSRLIGRNLKESDFRQVFGGLVLAIRRHGETIYSRLAETRLFSSDCLLVMVPKEKVPEMRQSEDMQIISEAEFSLSRERFWWLPLVLFPVVVLLAVFGVVEIMSGAVLGAILILMLGVLKPQETYRSIDWSVLLLIAAFVPVGDAMIRTGTADFLAAGILSAADLFQADWRLFGTLSLVYLITSLMTQMISNNAAAIILTPVALSLAGSLGVDPRPFLFAICFAASAEFMTPMGYQTNMMVYGPGGYRFLDYVRFGAPLNLAFWVLASLLIPFLWPFRLL